MKRQEGARKDFKNCGSRVAHSDLMPLAVCDGFSESYSVVHPLQCRAGFRKEDLAGFSETYRPCGALEKRDTHFGFQVTDLPAQRRLRNVESLSGSTHVLFLCNRHEITQMPEFHPKFTIPVRYTKGPIKYAAKSRRRESLECQRDSNEMQSRNITNSMKHGLRGFRLVALALSATVWASAQIPEGKLALGANTNENFQWATPQILDRTHTGWVRGFFPASQFISGQRSYYGDPALEALKRAADAGHKVILSIKWDSKNGGFGRMPQPGSPEEQVAFHFVDQLLDSADGRLSALVVINELSIDTLNADLVPGPDGRVPVIVFIRRVVEHVDAEDRKAADGSKLPIFAGGMTRLDLVPTQQAVATKLMIRLINNDPRITGADFHLHQPSMASTQRALEFIHHAIPNKPLMTTEFSLVFQWKAHLGDQVDSSESGKEFSNQYGLQPGITVAQFLTDVFERPVPVEEWHQFLASQPWFDGHYLADVVPLMQASGVKIVTYALTWNPEPVPNPKPVTIKTTPWFLNPLLVPGMAYVPDSTRVPENYELFTDYVNYQESRH